MPIKPTAIEFGDPNLRIPFITTRQAVLRGIGLRIGSQGRHQRSRLGTGFRAEIIRYRENIVLSTFPLINPRTKF